MNNWNNQVMEYFGWKSICEGEEGNHNCRYPQIHTHEFSDIDNEFRRSLDFEKIRQYKCDCGNHINENYFQLSYESWGASLGQDKEAFDMVFICNKCGYQCGNTRIISHNDILKNHIVDVNNMV